MAAYLFEESRETFLARAQGIGLKFLPFIDAGNFELVQVDIGALAPGEFTASVRRAVEQNNASVIVIDSLNGYLNGMPSEQFLMIHMHELLTYLGQRGVATLLTLAQHGVVGGNMQAPLDVSFLADTVVLLRYFEAMGSVRQAVSVVKKRRGGHERSIRELRIDSSGMRIGAVLSEFEGVLTGSPKYRGSNHELIDEEE